MKRSVTTLILLALLFVSAGTQQPGTGGINAPQQRDKPYLILISLDGFRADYLDRFTLPHIASVVRRGARAKWMNPVFPSLTFPNHYSLVTGLHPERHGIVNNTIYDPARRARYSLGDRDAVGDAAWYRGEPIWVTAERQGMVAASYFWPGSEAAIGGIRPTFWKTYDEEIPDDARVRTVLEWLRLPAERRPHVITMYFDDIDTASHENPLGSPNVEKAARALDGTIGLLLGGIDALPFGKHVNLLLTSDHGMVEATRLQTVILDSLVDVSHVEAIVDGAITSLHVGGDQARAVRLRDALNARLTRGAAWLRTDVPERYRYRTDPRIGDVVVVMDEGWSLRRAGRKPPRAERWGAHGWDNTLPSMRALFVAMGPRMRAGAVIEPVDNVDVYPLMTDLLGLRAAADIDGRPGRIFERIAK